MNYSANNISYSLPHLVKTRTGITGLDEITGGGIPAGRSTLICGQAGCGKTLMSIEFIVNGAMLYNEPGIFMAFEERAEELALNVASLGFDLSKLQKENKIRIDHVHIERTEIEETGEYDLEGLFIRLGHAIDSIGAKRVGLDTIENLFSSLINESILRAEIRPLFHWLKNKGVTAIITGEKGDGFLTRHGLEEYVSDCVILLDNRVNNQITTRLLRIIKYRGSVHGTNEYPFLIDEEGISVLPVTSLRLEKEVSKQRVPSGVESLDQMLDGKGFFEGSSILVSGTSGTGKTSIAGCFTHGVCERGQKCMYFAFEEAPKQIIRNLESIGIHLQPFVDQGLLQFNGARPTVYGLEMHLVAIHKAIMKFKPAVVVLDPITNLTTVGTMSEVKSMLIRLIDFLQTQNITVMFTALTYGSISDSLADEGVSSLVDAWIRVKDIELNGERNRGLYVMKSRGMKHSNQVREFIISDDGLSLEDVYIGPEGILTGSAREAHQLTEKIGEALQGYKIEHKDREILRKRLVLEAKIASMNTEFESVEEELNLIYREEELKKEIIVQNRQDLTRIRHQNNQGGTKPEEDNRNE